MVLRKHIIVMAIGAAGIVAPIAVLAHCPLCTAGAGLIAIGAYWFGVKAMTIGIGLGALAMAMGLWFANLIKRKFIPQQYTIVVAVTWLFTLVPLRSLFADYASWYVNWGGSYGSIFNRTYIVNLFWVGAILGTLIMLVAPMLSRFITKFRGNRQLPFQGMLLILSLVIVVSIITQLL